MAKYDDYNKTNQQFLEDNGQRPEITTLKGGVQYRVKVAGKGAIPSPNSIVHVYYSGKMINGKQFDSNMGDSVPTLFRVRELIVGWQHALLNMPVGSKWEIYIPSHLGYGKRSAGAIKPFSTLIFELHLVAIS